MKSKELKETKPGTKNLPATKKKKAKKKDRRGGARPNAGRKGNAWETQQIHVDIPTQLIEGMRLANIENKTAYINALIANDLKFRNLGKTIKKAIEEVLKPLKEKTKAIKKPGN